MKALSKLMKKNIHRGGDFRDFLKADGILEKVEERAEKQAAEFRRSESSKQQNLPNEKSRIAGV
jgi:hypothetical protein